MTTFDDRFRSFRRTVKRARLRERRWSTTRIAEAIGVSDETVRRDLSGSRNLEPESP